MFWFIFDWYNGFSLDGIYVYLFFLRKTFVIGSLSTSRCYEIFTPEIPFSVMVSISHCIELLFSKRSKRVLPTQPCQLDRKKSRLPITYTSFPFTQKLNFILHFWTVLIKKLFFSSPTILYTYSFSLKFFFFFSFFFLYAYSL